MTAPPPIDQCVTFIYTHDLAATTQWYEDVLGLECVLVQTCCKIYRTGGSGFLGICSRPNRTVEPRGVVFTMVSSDVDGWYARLKGKGVTIEGPPELSTEFNVYAFFAADPNGYKLEFQEFRDPAWPKGSKA